MPRGEEAARSELVAEKFLSEAGVVEPPDAFELAQQAGLTPVAADVARAELAPDGTLRYRAGARPRDQQRWVARQLAVWLLERGRLSASTSATVHTAAALLLPRERFMQDADATGWNVRELRGLYPNASLRTIAYRVVTLRDAAATWFDHGRSLWRSVSPAFCPQLETPTRFEQHLAEISLAADEVLHPEDRVWAFPSHRRHGMTLLLCDAERLVGRLGDGSGRRLDS